MNNSTAPPGDALAGPQTPAGPQAPPGADLVAELHAAREAQAIAEARAAQFEAERDAAAAARKSLRSLAAHLIGERAYLAGQLDSGVSTALEADQVRLPLSSSENAERGERDRSRRECRPGSQAPPRSAARRASTVPRPARRSGAKASRHSDRSSSPRMSAPLSHADVASVRLPTSDHPIVSVIIPSFGKPRLTFQCLKSIAAFRPAIPFEVIVTDDARAIPGLNS